MLRKVGFVLALGAMLQGAGVARGRAPEILTRSGKWVVNYDRDACHLLAQFGTGDASVVMRITRYEPGDFFDLSLFGKRMSSRDFRTDAKLDFGLESAPVEVRALAGNADKLPGMFFNPLRLDGWQRSSVEQQQALGITPAQEAAVTGMTVDIRGKRPFRLDFGSLGKPFEQMRACSASLVRSWGYDPEVQAGLSRPVKPQDSPATWLNDRDFPSSALRQGHSGIVQFRLDVDPEGKVAGCFILARTSPDDFADLTCKMITRRAKLSPALDAKGVPVRSYFVQKVRWLMG